MHVTVHLYHSDVMNRNMSYIWLITYVIAISLTKVQGKNEYPRKQKNEHPSKQKNEQMCFEHEFQKWKIEMRNWKIQQKGKL